MPDYLLEIINTQTKLTALAERLGSVPALALDIETALWWDKYRERVALVQIAYRQTANAGQGIKVSVVDALAEEINLEALRPALESQETVKAIHNSAFDAGKLFKHFKFKVAPVFDTMAAARRNGEKKYSLAAQAAAHLKLQLEKSARRSDWSRRPLDIRQIDYAARDAYATFLLYEYQRRHGLTGEYRLRYDSSTAVQGTFDLTSPEPQTALEPVTEVSAERHPLVPEREAILDIVTRLPDRYSPAQLASSVGLPQRVGLIGWIVDHALGRDTDFDEGTARLIIADLFEQKLVRVNEFQKLEAVVTNSDSEA